MPGPEGYNIERLVQLREAVVYEVTQDAHDQRMRGRFTGRVAETFGWGGSRYAPVSCPSSACAAGWTVVDAKAKMLFHKSPIDDMVDGVSEWCVTTDGDVRPIRDYAAELLGLDEDEADTLFAADPSSRQTLKNIEQIIVAAKHGRTWQQQRGLGRLPVVELEQV